MQDNQSHENLSKQSGSYWKHRRRGFYIAIIILMISATLLLSSVLFLDKFQNEIFYITYISAVGVIAVISTIMIGIYYLTSANWDKNVLLNLINLFNK